LEFCPSWGSRLEPKKTGIGNAFVLCCAKCNFTKQPIEKKATTGAVIQPKAKPFMSVLGQNDEVYVWMVQTRGGDEAMTQFMRCTKCGHTFREYT